MDKKKIIDRLNSMGCELPESQGSSYSYDTVVIAAGLAFVSGQVPKKDGKIVWQGAVGKPLTNEDGVSAAQLCALNVLSQIDRSVGLENIDRLVKLTVYVASSDDFEDQAAIAEGASILFREALGEQGRHSRTAVGVAKLPKNSAVEVDAIFSIRT